ncbi:hypothetical protein [Silicimonas sp. MF1-12-2]|uniref:hypothetical protein n=1 Tax=Silicimonas sp. MF1-12-2 TaxID=3384793 RepID=UPI0039B424E2
MTPIAQASAIAAIVLGTGAATVTVLNEDIADMAVPDGPWEPGIGLDGRIFHTTDRVEETGEILNDELHFKDGRFQSVMCQQYCDFGWSEYQTWTEGETIHFTTTTTCPDAPHSVVWYGTVTGDRIDFEGTWTTRRWYWTRQINVSGTGSPTPPDAPAASG